MARWWRLWSGHVLLVLLMILMAACGLFILVYVRTTELRVLFPIAVFFFGAVVVGILTAWRYNTGRERYRIRNEWRLTERGYSALRTPGEGE